MPTADPHIRRASPAAPTQAGGQPDDAYRTALATAVVVLAPLLLVTGRALMMTPAARAFTAAWTVAHVVFLAGTVLMMPAALAVSRFTSDVAAPWLRDIGVALVFVGAQALAAQFVLDLGVAVLSEGDPQRGGALFDRLQAVTAIDILLYSVGPSLLFIGLMVLAAAVLRVPAQWRWAGGALALGPILVGVGRAIDGALVEVTGLVLIAVALIAVAAVGATTTSRRA